MWAIFQTVYGSHPSAEVLATANLDVIPEGQQKVHVKDHLYVVVGHEWHIDGKPFETADSFYYPPYVIVRLQ